MLLNLDESLCYLMVDINVIVIVIVNE